MDQALATTTVRKHTHPAGLLTDWPPADIEKLVTLYNEGKTMAFIATIFHKTRSSVAGKIGRLRASGKYDLPEKLIRNTAARKPKPERPKNLNPALRNFGRRPQVIAVVAKKKIIRVRMMDPENNVTLAELEQQHCKWPLGDPRLADFRYCGCARLSTSSRTPYCYGHTSMAAREIYENGQRRDATRL